MDRIRVLFEEKENLKNIDIRRYDFYLSKAEQDAWDKRNILYNTLWFYSNKSNKYPEVEYSDTVTDTYKFLLPFKAWEIVYHEYGKVFDPPKYKHNGRGRFCADIMNGWWNPFKYFLGLSDSISRKSIKEMINKKEVPLEKEPIKGALSLEEVEKLTPEIINRAKKTKLFKWFSSKREKIAVEEIHKFLRFLKVVYTIGNIVPTPTFRTCGHNLNKNLDDWYGKQTFINQIEDKDYGKETLDNWHSYISCYEGKTYNDKFDNFIIKNYLQGYFCNKEIKSYWKNCKHDKEPKSIEEATPNDWTIYFENATERINDRNDAIEKELRKVMNNA